MLKVKVKVCTLDIAPIRETPPQKRSGMTSVLSGSQFYLHVHTFIHNRNELYPPLPSQLYGTHLLTPEGWKAELVWVAGYVTCEDVMYGILKCHFSAHKIRIVSLSNVRILMLRIAV